MEYPLVPHRPPKFNTRTTTFQHLKSFSSTPKSLSSTHPSVPHRKLFSSTHLLVLKWGVFGVELRGVWNWGVFGVELKDFGVELIDSGCWKGGVLVLNWGGLELRGTKIRDILDKFDSFFSPRKMFNPNRTQRKGDALDKDILNRFKRRSSPLFVKSVSEHHLGPILELHAF